MSKERPHCIVKVQVPLFTTDTKHPRYLVYAEGRKYVREQGLPPAMRSFLKGEVKMFFWAKLSEKTNVWELIKPAPNMEW